MNSLKRILRVVMRIYGLLALASVASAFIAPSPRGATFTKKDAVVLSAQSSNHHDSARRSLLSTAFAVGALIPANEAHADFSNPFNNKNKATTPTQKPRVGGGMASKIRKVGTVMVRESRHF